MIFFGALGGAHGGGGCGGGGALGGGGGVICATGVNILAIGENHLRHWRELFAPLARIIYTRRE